MAKTGRPKKGADPATRVRCYLSRADLDALDIACGWRELTRSDGLRDALRHWTPWAAPARVRRTPRTWCSIAVYTKGLPAFADPKITPRARRRAGPRRLYRDVSSGKRRS